MKPTMKRARLLISMVGAAVLVMTLVTPAGATHDTRALTSTFEVTITNNTGGQPLTPPLVLTHRASVELFEVGEVASEGIKEIAENGNLAPAVEFVMENKHVIDFVVALGDPPPIVPGASRTFEITAERGAKFLSWASMLICTNDGFTGVDSVRLPKVVGDTVTVNTDAYDAGTEINTEDLADIVPPCQIVVGVEDETSAGTGMSNPALAENGVITHHAGIQGIDDLVPSIHGWTNPPATITITRTG